MLMYLQPGKLTFGRLSRLSQPAKPKPRVKKGTPRDITVVVREATRIGNEEFTQFVATGKLRSTK